MKTPEYLSVTLQSQLASKLGCEVSRDAAILMRDMFANAQREARAGAFEEAAKVCDVMEDENRLHLNVEFLGMAAMEIRSLSSPVKK